jgi:hypothetical protein
METTKRKATPQQLANLAKARATRAANKAAAKKNRSPVMAPTAEDIAKHGASRSLSRDKKIMREVYDEKVCKGWSWPVICKKHGINHVDAQSILDDAKAAIQDGTLFMN